MNTLIKTRFRNLTDSFIDFHTVPVISLGAQGSSNDTVEIDGDFFSRCQLDGDSTAVLTAVLSDKISLEFLVDPLVIRDVKNVPVFQAPGQISELARKALEKANAGYPADKPSHEELTSENKEPEKLGEGDEAPEKLGEGDEAPVEPAQEAVSETVPPAEPAEAAAASPEAPTTAEEAQEVLEPAAETTPDVISESAPLPDMAAPTPEAEISAKVKAIRAKKNTTKME